MIIAGSFLKIQNEKDKIDKLNKAVDQIHFDVMDGKFTENKTLDINDIEKNVKDIDKPIDVHLMVYDVEKYVDDFLKFNPKYFTFHIETTDNPKKYIDYIKSKNVKVGLAINPDTDIEKIYPYLDKVDLILIMSVPPGKGGQKFIDISGRIKMIKNHRTNNHLSFKIEVDGGINNQTIKKVRDADIVVCGSYITDSSDYQKNVNILRGDLNE
ncbi:MAG: ribulose-phosphate 3-epimerase [Bacilli bacterium]|nr:ribulose-phosphate 3-epimerase [Bacilli bacterium]